MGIDLPAELRGVAERAGARWPEADEDALRAAAEAWRSAALSIDGLAREANGTAQGAFAVLCDAAVRGEWERFAGAGVRFPRSVETCGAAAERLEHAAEQIGAAKTRMVRELVELARSEAAAEQAAAAGNPQALAGLEAASRSASEALAQLRATLRRTVDAESGVMVESGAAPGEVLDIASGGSGKADEVAGRTADRAGGSARQARTPETGFSGPVGGTGAQWQGDAEHTGPVARNIVSAAESDPHTPVTGQGRPWPAGSEDQASVTAPHSVRQMRFAHPGPGPGGPSTGGAAPGAVPGFVPAPPPGSGNFQEQRRVQPSRHPAQQSPAHQQPARQPPAGRHPASAPGAPLHSQHPPVTGPAPASPRRQVPRRGAMRPAAPGVSPLPGAHPPLPPAVAPPKAAQRPLRKGGRDPAVVAFVLHQFPFGHMPMASGRASLQLPALGQEDQQAASRFAPLDHPHAELVDDSDALARVRSGETSLPPVGEEQEIPNELVDGHDPVGGRSELEWEREYVTSPRSEAAGHRTQYAWPPGDVHPEGGVEVGEPVVLEPDTVIDALGEGWGRVLYAETSSFEQRCLPPEHLRRAYRRYRVLRPLPVWQATTAPWFGQPGGGARYRTTHPIAELTALGLLVQLTASSQAAEAQTLRIDRAQVAEAAAAGGGGVIAEAPDAQAAGETTQEAGK